MKIFKYTYWTFTIGVSICSILSFFKIFNDDQPKFKANGEAYDVRLSNVKNLQQVDSIFKIHLSNDDTLNAVNAIDHFIRNRFYHGYSRYTMNDNWIAYLAGFVWQDFKLIVSPKETIRYSSAACSQQELIFQTILKQNNIRFRTVAFEPVPNRYSGHFTLEVFVNNDWHYYDTNLEPKILGNERPSLAQIKKDSLYLKMYNKSFNQTLQFMFQESNVYPKDENVIPGQKMIIFQTLTGWMSNYLFLLLIGIGVFFHRRKAKS